MFTGTLGEAAEDPARLVPLKHTISMELMLEGRLPSDDVGARWARNKIPSLVFQQGAVLILHSSQPIWVGKGATEGLQNRRHEGGSIECREAKPHLGPGGHAVLVHHRGNMHGSLWQGSRISRRGLCFSSFLDYTVQLRHSQPTHTHP